MINEYIERQRELMGLNENLEIKLRRRYPKIQQIVNDVLYDSPDNAIDGVLETSDDEFEFADSVIDVVLDMILIDGLDDMNLSDDEIDELREFIKDEFGMEMIEYFYENNEP